MPVATYVHGIQFSGNAILSTNRTPILIMRYELSIARVTLVTVVMHTPGGRVIDSPCRQAPVAARLVSLHRCSFGND